MSQPPRSLRAQCLVKCEIFSCFVVFFGIALLIIGAVKAAGISTAKKKPFSSNEPENFKLVSKIFFICGGVILVIGLIFVLSIYLKVKAERRENTTAQGGNMVLTGIGTTNQVEYHPFISGPVEQGQNIQNPYYTGRQAQPSPTTGHGQHYTAQYRQEPQDLPYPTGMPAGAHVPVAPSQYEQGQPYPIPASAPESQYPIPQCSPGYYEQGHPVPLSSPGYYGRGDQYPVGSSRPYAQQSQGQPYSMPMGVQGQQYTNRGGQEKTDDVEIPSGYSLHGSAQANAPPPPYFEAIAQSKI